MVGLRVGKRGRIKGGKRGRVNGREKGEGLRVGKRRKGEEWWKG